MSRLLIIGGMAAALTIAASASAQNERHWNYPGWRTIAYKTVSGRDTDTIYSPGRIYQRAVRLCAINAPIHLIDFDVRFANGGHQDVSTRALIQGGTCTRAVDLKGGRRDISLIRLRYQPVARNARRPLIRVQVR